MSFDFNKFKTQGTIEPTGTISPVQTTPGKFDFNTFKTQGSSIPTPVVTPTPTVVGTLTAPLREGFQGLKTLYGGGEQGIANKLYQDIQAGAQDIQNGIAMGEATPANSTEGFNQRIAAGGQIIKGMTKASFRTAGDVAGLIYAPVGAALGATGINKVFDYLGELSQKGGNYNPINLITDSKMVQDFVMARPNLEEDLGRALNIAFAKAETGKIKPSTVIPRTIAQVESGIAKTKAIPGQVVLKTKSITGRLPEDIVNKRVSELENISENYAQLRKETNFNPERAKESVKRVASTDVLANAVDENGLIRTKQPGGAVDEYAAQTLDHAENVVRKNLVRLGEKVTPEEVLVRLEDAINRSGLEGSDLKIALNKAKREISGYKLKADADGNIPLEVIHDAKIATGKKVRDFTTPSEIKTYEKAIGEALKETVEKNSTFNVREVNGEISKYLQDIKFLEQLDGKKVKGGKLGKYFARISGNIIGGAIGTAVGGHIGTAIGSAVGGEVAGRVQGSILSKTLSGKTGYTAPKNPIIEKAVADKNKPQLMLPSPQKGTPRSSVISNTVIPIAPIGAKMEFTGKDYSNSLGNRNAQYQTPNTIIKNDTINQVNKTTDKATPASINNTSNLTITNTIPQKIKASVENILNILNILNSNKGFIRLSDGKISKTIKVTPDDIKILKDISAAYKEQELVKQNMKSSTVPVPTGLSLKVEQSILEHFGFPTSGKSLTGISKKIDKFIENYEKELVKRKK